MGQIYTLQNSKNSKVAQLFSWKNEKMLLKKKELVTKGKGMKLWDPQNNLTQFAYIVSMHELHK